MYKIKILPNNVELETQGGISLMGVLQAAQIFVDAPCGGKGKCGKCKVIVKDQEVLACQMIIDHDMDVVIPQKAELNVLYSGLDIVHRVNPIKEGVLAAFDIGTTSVVCFLLDGKTGQELASSSMLNPQTAFGADIISRIQAALDNNLDKECLAIRQGMTELIQKVCMQVGISPKGIHVVSVVGNPAMQQLFLGISPQNLAEIPFAPVLTDAKTVPCKDILPICHDAELLIVPDISGYIGADTMGCILSTQMYKSEEITLMVDIGTNGEMVLGNKDRMIACSTAAGPALEGANIQFGMRGVNGAIDHIWLEEETLQYSIIGGEKANGICGSGLIDAIAALLDAGQINKRGRIQSAQELEGQRVVYLTPDIYLTQSDIREVQLAKGAIAAGIELMTQHLGITFDQIERVLLAGAFGSFMDADNACRIGLIPEALHGKIQAVGNAAGSGAKMLAYDKNMLPLTQELANKIEFLELAKIPNFQRVFAKNMNFREEKS